MIKSLIELITKLIDANFNIKLVDSLNIPLPVPCMLLLIPWVPHPCMNKGIDKCVFCKARVITWKYKWPLIAG